MYCVVQTLERKKPDTGGEYMEYEVSSMTIGFPDGRSKTHYSYYPRYEAGRFHRPHRECFKISIHESRREGGRVVKKQCVVGTVGYYELIQWGLYDYIDNGVNRATDVFGADYETLYRLVENKMSPIMEKVKKEFRRSEEYKARRAREKLEKAHQKAKKQFGAQYGVDPDEYDYVYNIFGELMDEEYLKEIVRQCERQQKAYERRYREYSGGTYTGGGGGSYSVPVRGTYTAEETAILKQFYRSLSKTYHPDLNPGKDTTAEMQLLNKLKEAWGV